MRDRWLTGCVVLALSACGGVVRTSPGGDAGSATDGGTGSSMGGSGPVEGGASTGGLSGAGSGNVGGRMSMQVPCGKTFCPADSVCCNAICGVCGTADGVCPDIGCMPPMRDCASLPTAPRVLSCAQEYGKPTDGGTVMVSAPNAELTSEVSGALMAGCLEPLLELEPNRAALSAQAMSWIVADGTRKWDVEALVEGSKIPSLGGGGQKVSLSYTYQFGGFGPTRRQLSLVTQMSPSHGVWTAEGGDLPDLGKLPLPLTRGNPVCSSNEQCGSYQRYDISATDPLSMKMLTVSHGQAATFGPWVIVHGGYEEQTSANSACADWFVANVRVAILGLM